MVHMLWPCAALPSTARWRGGAGYQMTHRLQEFGCQTTLQPGALRLKMTRLVFPTLCNLTGTCTPLCCIHNDQLDERLGRTTMRCSNMLLHQSQLCLSPATRCSACKALHWKNIYACPKELIIRSLIFALLKKLTRRRRPRLWSVVVLSSI